MSSGKQKRQKLKLRLAERNEKSERVEIQAGIMQGTVIAVEKSKLFSCSAIPKVPDYYRDLWFTCKDCGQQDLWTAKKQQQWYEVQGGKIETIAILCKTCRREEKLRRETARKIHLEGLATKKKRRTNDIT